MIRGLFSFLSKKERDFINKKTSLIQNERGLIEIIFKLAFELRQVSFFKGFFKICIRVTLPTALCTG